MKKYISFLIVISSLLISYLISSAGEVNYLPPRFSIPVPISSGGTGTTLPSLVPYIGATTGVDLNGQHLVNIVHLGVGTTSTPSILARFIGDNTALSRVAIRGYSNNSSGPAFRVSKFRGTEGSPGTVWNGDTLGRYQFAGYDGTGSDGIVGAYIHSHATETWSSTANGANMEFAVTSNGTVTPGIVLSLYDSYATFTVPLISREVITSVTCSAQTYTIDASLATLFSVTISSTGTCTFDIGTLLAGQSFSIESIQTGTYPIAFTSSYKWPAGTKPTFSTTATKSDVISCASFKGATLLCNGIVDVR